MIIVCKDREIRKELEENIKDICVYYKYESEIFRNTSYLSEVPFAADIFSKNIAQKSVNHEIVMTDFPLPVHRILNKCPIIYITYIERGGNGTVPSVVGYGLQDAIYAIENSGYKCSHTGMGHVVSQSPKAGEKAAKGETVKIVLK